MSLEYLYRVLDSGTPISIIDAKTDEYLWIGKPDMIPFSLMGKMVTRIKGIRIYVED